MDRISTSGFGHKSGIAVLLFAFFAGIAIWFDGIKVSVILYLLDFGTGITIFFIRSNSTSLIIQISIN
jgi:hypothetical protein